MRAHVLAIDDNVGDVTLLREALVEAGITAGVDHADSGEAAIELLTRLADDEPPCLPALVLCDLTLPGISGAEVLRFLRGHPTLQSVPALLLTGHTLDQVARAGEVEREHVRQKPRDFDGYLALAEELRARIA